MKKEVEQKESQAEEMPAPVTFEVGEEILFCPSTGAKEEVTVLELPKEGSSKYRVKGANWESPVNACYLAKKP